MAFNDLGRASRSQVCRSRIHLVVRALINLIAEAVSSDRSFSTDLGIFAESHMDKIISRVRIAQALGVEK